MYSRVVSPFYSLILRGVVFLVLLTISLLVYTGFYPYVGSSIPHYVFSKIHMNVRFIDLFQTLTPYILLVLAVVISFRKGVFLGLALLPGIYTELICIILLSLMIYSLYISYIYFLDFEKDLMIITTTIIITIVNSIILYYYPKIALSIVRRSNGRNISIDLGLEEIALNNREIIRIIIYGDIKDLGLSFEPQDSYSIVDRGDTFTHHYIDLIPVSSFGGLLTITYKGRVVFRKKFTFKDYVYKRIVFQVYLNDDYIGDYEYSIEEFKTVEQGFKPVLENISSKIGFDIDNVKKIQYYTQDDIHIPPSTRIYELSGNVIKAKIYIVEKYMELLRRYGKEDLFQLWDKLVKRISILMDELKRLSDYYLISKSKINIVKDNWW